MEGVVISLAPGPMFSPSGRYQRFLRLNCSVPWSEEVERAVATVGAIARDLSAAR